VTRFVPTWVRSGWTCSLCCRQRVSSGPGQMVYRFCFCFVCCCFCLLFLCCVVFGFDMFTVRFVFLYSNVIHCDSEQTVTDMDEEGDDDDDVEWICVQVDGDCLGTILYQPVKLPSCSLKENSMLWLYTRLTTVCLYGCLMCCLFVCMYMSVCLFVYMLRCQLQYVWWMDVR